MPTPYTWNTGDQITAARLNSTAQALATVATTGSYTDLTGKPAIPSVNPWQFRPEDYGAVGNGSTDDTAAINATVAAAFAYAQANRFYAEVVFRDRTYLVSGPLVQGGTAKTNAQIPLPMNAQTAHKVTLAFKGVGDAAALPHWLQTVPQAAGTVLKSTLTGQSYSGTYGLPAVIGGPTQEQGYATDTNQWNNMLVVVDGITIQVPVNPTICGFQFMAVAEANVVNAAVQAAQTVPSAVTPTNFSIGLIMPYNGNNAYCEVGKFSSEGVYRAISLGEHANLNSLRALNCDTAIGVTGGLRHSILVGYACVEACNRAVQYVDVSPVPFSSTLTQIHIMQLDYENNPSIDDANNHLHGEIRYNPNAGASSFPIARNGATGLRLIDISQTSGQRTTPSLPGSTTALLNPFDRDCAVTITGGTVTGIAVDGLSLGVTSGTVFVPTNKTITLTYSSAPTWKWIAL